VISDLIIYYLNYISIGSLIDLEDLEEEDLKYLEMYIYEIETK